MLYQIKNLNLLIIHIFNLLLKISCQKDKKNIYKLMSLYTIVVSIHSHFTIMNKKMGKFKALFEEILLLTKSNEPYCHF